MTFHFTYGGSTIKRIAKCPGSPAAIAALGPRSGGEAAERGTRIHARLEQLWANPKSKTALSKEEEATAQLLFAKLREIAPLHGFLPEEIVFEQQVKLTSVHPEKAGGTVDQHRARAFDDLFVCDTKTGNVQIYPEENWQLLWYAIGVMDGLKPSVRDTIENVHLLIMQPCGGEIVVRRWTIPASALDAYRVMFKDIVDYAEANPELRIAGDHCDDMWCDARNSCPAYIQREQEATNGFLLKALAGEKIPAEQGERLAEQLEACDRAEKVIKSIRDEATRMVMLQPTSIPGWGLVDGLGNRTWNLPEKELIKTLKDAGFKLDDVAPRGLATPKQIEDLAKARGIDGFKEVPAELVYRPRTKAKLGRLKEDPTQQLQSFAPAPEMAPTT